MAGLNHIKLPVAPELKEFENQFKDIVKSDIKLLNIIINYVLKTKGKQLRPLFVFLSAKIHGNISQSTYIAASLIELLHTASLIHDDVVDESYERRGFFSINALWKSKVSVLFGDFLLSKGLLLSVDNNEFELLRIVSNAVREMSEGELMQIYKSRKLNITESEYIEIIRKKTAALIAACCACGAKSIGSDEEVVNKMWKFGELLGIAFQIKDDLLDYETKGLTGKPSGNDIKEKKLTLPLIHSLSVSNNSLSNKIIRIIDKKHKSTQKINDVIEFVKDSGGISYAEEVMNTYKKEALEILSIYPETPALQSIRDLTDFVVNRSK